MEYYGIPLEGRILLMIAAIVLLYESLHFAIDAMRGHVLSSIFESLQVSTVSISAGPANVSWISGMDHTCTQQDRLRTEYVECNILASRHLLGHMHPTLSSN